MLKKKKYAKWANGDEGPDWGDLKHNEKEQEIALKKVKEVGTTDFGMLRDMLKWCCIFRLSKK